VGAVVGSVVVTVFHLVPRRKKNASAVADSH